MGDHAVTKIDHANHLLLVSPPLCKQRDHMFITTITLWRHS